MPGQPQAKSRRPQVPLPPCIPDLVCIVLMRGGPFPQLTGHLRIELLGERIAGASCALARQTNGSYIGCDAPRQADVAHVADVVPGELASDEAAS